MQTNKQGNKSKTKIYTNRCYSFGFQDILRREKSKVGNICHGVENGYSCHGYRHSQRNVSERMRNNSNFIEGKI